MRGRSWAAIGGVFLSLALCSTASAQFSPGSRSLGDVYLPALGNGGYDAQHYDVSINYDPAQHFMTSSATVTARATQGLSEFSLDFLADDFTVTGVSVNGAAATWTKDVDAATFKYKLVVTPAAGIANNTTFTVKVDYAGNPRNFEDPDDSFEGFMRTTTLARRLRGQRADGRDGLVPEQQPPARQGDLRLAPDGSGRLQHRRQRRTRQRRPGR